MKRAAGGSLLYQPTGYETDTHHVSSRQPSGYRQLRVAHKSATQWLLYGHDRHGVRPMTHRQTRLWLLVPFAALVLLKIPGALTGRLWAEDALYFLDAVHLPWWQALFVPHTGYIDLTASGSMLIATRLGNLEQVGLFSVLMALIVQ